jgi:DnaA family protein
MKQLILDLAWDPLPPFAGFLPGGNDAVVAQLREQAWPGAPVYLWGPAGSGKTQLLHELQSRAVEDGLMAQWFDASSTTPWELADDAALVLLDGVDQFGADQQHAAFTLFVEAASRVGGVIHALADGVAGAALAVAETPAVGALSGARLGVQFASAGRLPPVDLQVREDLRTRLGWGPVHAVQPLAESGTRHALHQEARRRGIVLGDEVLDYILARFARDLKSLMHLLHRLDGFALAEKRAVTVPLLKRMLDEEQSEKQPDLPFPE